MRNKPFGSKHFSELSKRMVLLDKTTVQYQNMYILHNTGNTKIKTGDSYLDLN